MKEEHGEEKEIIKTWKIKAEQKKKNREWEKKKDC